MSFGALNQIEVGRERGGALIHLSPPLPSSTRGKKKTFEIKFCLGFLALTLALSLSLPLENKARTLSQGVMSDIIWRFGNLFAGFFVRF